MKPNLIKELMDRAATAIAAQNVEEMIRISALVDRAKKAQEAIATLEQELAAISAEAQDTAPVVQPEPLKMTIPYDSGSGELHVEINWPALGVSRPPVAFNEHSGKKALIKFVQELRAGLGDTVLEKLTTLRVSRGPLVSKQPSVDYKNPRRGYLYNHARLGGTPYALLTHSSNAEKIEIMRSAIAHLGLDVSKFRIQPASSGGTTREALRKEILRTL